jgi:hypothetical protein
MDSDASQQQMILQDAMTGMDTDYLNLTNVQHSAFLQTLAWFVGPSVLEPERVAAVTNKQVGTLTVYWITGNAFGSLTVHRSDTSAVPEMTGRFRPLAAIRNLEIKADVRQKDGVPSPTLDVTVRPGVTIHWYDDDDSVEISAISLNDQSAAARIACFIRTLQDRISGLT